MYCRNVKFLFVGTCHETCGNDGTFNSNFQIFAEYLDMSNALGQQNEVNSDADLVKRVITCEELLIMKLKLNRSNEIVRTTKTEKNSTRQFIYKNLAHGFPRQSLRSAKVLTTKSQFSVMFC